MTAFFNRHLALGLAAATLLLAGCQNLSSPVIRFDRQVNYGDAKGVELVTNEFGSSDLQMIAEKMTGSLLETGIFQGRPTVTISTVKNKTSEYIDTTNVMNSIQTALVKSGKVRFVRSIKEMQSGVVCAADAAAAGPHGADGIPSGGCRETAREHGPLPAGGGASP